jgi:branched-chain amino acid transport system permease protein
MSFPIDLLNAVLLFVLDLLNGALQPVLKELAALGFREPVVQFMLINAILGVSIYFTLNCGLFSLANAGFMAIGAYVSVILTLHSNAGFGVSLLAGALAAGLVAIPIGLPVLRLRNIYLAIATIGFGEIVRIVILNFDSLATDLLHPDKPIELTFGPRGIKRIPTLTETSHLVLFLIFLGFVLYRMQRSRLGRAMKAIRQDEKVASTLGIHVVYYKNLSFFLGALVAGAAGGFSGHATRIITPNDYGFDNAVDILAYAVLGGLSHWSGPMIGGIALKAIPERLRYLKEYTGALTGSVLLLIIIFLPNGLVSLAQASFWRQGRRYDQARRLASVGMALVMLVNILPYRDLGKGDNVVIGYDYWGPVGVAVMLGVLYWLSTRQPNPNGGRFSWLLSAAAAITGTVFLVIGLTKTVTQLGDGYYVLLFGLVVVIAAGLIRYPPEENEELSPPEQHPPVSIYPANG